MHAAMDSHAHYVSAQAEQAHNFAIKQHNMVIADATTGSAKQGFLLQYTVDTRGLVGPDGKVIVKKDDPNFATTVHSVTSQMKAPIVKSAGPDGRPNENLFTNAEIAAAKASHAEAVPSDASMMASQLAAMKVTTTLSQPNANIALALNDTAAFCQNLSNGIEEETYRLDPEELNNDPSLYGNAKPEKLVKFEEAVYELSDDKKAVLSDGLRQASKELSGTSVRRVEKQDLAMEDMGHELDNELASGDVGEHELGAPEMDTDVISMEGV